MGKTRIDNIISCVLMYAISSFFIFQAGNFSEGSASFPVTVGWILIGLTTLLLVQTLTGKTGQRKKAEDTIPAKFHLAAGLSVIYVLLVNVAGYIVMTPLYLFALIVGLGFRNMKIAAIISAIVTAFVYLGFKIALGVPIPEGIFLR